MKRTRKITAAFLALIMALSVLTAAPFTVDAASNNTQETAKSISTNTTYTDSLSVQGQVDYYKFTLSSASKVSINFKHSYIESNDTYWKATLYNTNGDEFVYLSSTGKNTDLTSSNVGLPSGTYYIKIYHDWYYYQNINYSFKVNSSSQSAWETEENDSYATGDSISLNKTYYGSLAMQGDVDYYKFTLSSSSKISINLKHTYIDSGENYWKVALYNMNGDELVYLSSTGKNTDLTSSNVGLPSGSYYIKIYHDWYYYQDIDYSFKVNSSSQSAWETEVNDSYATGDSISLDKTYYGSFAEQGDVDYYKFSLSSSKTVTFNFKHSYIDSDDTYWKISLCNTKGDELLYLESSGKNKSLTSSKVTLSSGSYYIKIYHQWYYYQNIDYSFSVNKLTLSTPKISSIANTTSGVKISWGKVSNASGYYIYRATSSSGSYTKIATVKSGSTLSYTNKTSGTYKVSSGKTYYYKVVAYSGSTTSSKSTAKSIRYLTAGKVSSLTNTSKGITVKWNKVSGASGYYVYRKTSSGSYSKIKTITSGSTVSYSDTAVKSKNGTTYVYAVRPYYGSTRGSYAGKKIVRMTGVSLSSVKNSASKKMTVKWAKNSKASGYQIQYSTSSSFSSYKTASVSGASSVSKTIGSLTKGKTYYVRVRAYKTVSGTKYYSAWSGKKSVKISK